MTVPERILVPIDLSSRSLLGFDYAAMPAGITSAQLVLYCNVNFPERAVLEEFGKVEHLAVDEAGQLQLKRLAVQLAPRLILAAFVRQIIGQPCRTFRSVHGSAVAGVVA